MRDIVWNGSIDIPKHGCALRARHICPSFVLAQDPFSIRTNSKFPAKVAKRENNASSANDAAKNGDFQTTNYFGVVLACYLGLQFKPMNEAADLQKVPISRKGCPCCAFDLFLPPSLLDTNVAASETPENDDAPVSPQQALDILVAAAANERESNNGKGNNPLVIVDTHCHAQLERDRDETYELNAKGPGCDAVLEQVQLKAIVCAVEPADWNATLALSAKSSLYLPALGIHPWYLGDGLPDGWLSQLEALLLEHPSAIVGEIGLCKMARWTRQYADGKAAAFEIQRTVFQQQLQLAARLRRPVSIHCVNQHTVLVQALKDIVSTSNDKPCQALPPAIAMHSFTGTAHHAKELIALEKQWNFDHPLFYFGFSHTVNYVMNTSEKARRKGKEAVCAIPLGCLLVESDVHSSQDLLGGTAGAIAYVAWARQESIPHVANVTSQNAISYLASSLSI